MSKQKSEQTKVTVVSIYDILTALIQIGHVNKMNKYAEI